MVHAQPRRGRKGDIDMSGKTVWISDSAWRTIPYETRKDLLRVMPRERFVERYGANAESDLRALGEHELAVRLIKSLQDLPCPLRSR